jgi:DNA/RNA-binding domain of Phe-tRNA-synthetase-like protein
LEDIARIPAVYHTREAYKALGKKPARYRVSSEALHRRIVQEKGLYFINNLVDINNLISIRSGFGICLYDREKIEGDMNFRIARKGETYRGIGKYDLNLENLPVFADDLGPFGSPTSDSERTMITNQTQRISFHIIAFQLDIDLQPWLQQAQELMLRFADGGDFELGLSAG